MATQVVLGVSEDGADDLLLDDLARQLRGALLETDVDSVEPLAVGEAPEGTRSATMMAAGALIAAVSPLGLQGVVGVPSGASPTASGSTLSTSVSSLSLIHI